MGKKSENTKGPRQLRQKTGIRKSSQARAESDLSLKSLADWFERQKRVLPWRDNPSLYRVWVSEIMLQQTQVVTVIPYFERFVNRFPTVESLASAPQDDVLLHWAGLGYYSRARNLHKGAQQIVAAGHFPATREEWLEIPGVGQYTAGAVLSIALDQPEAILDGNVERVLSRVYKVSRSEGDTVYKARLWELSREWVSRAFAKKIRPNVLNQALMELGATVCTPRKPLCVVCPLSASCEAQASGEQELYPPRKKPKEWLQVREVLHCVLDGRGQVLLHQRQEKQWRAGLWDLLSERPAGQAFESVGTIETRHIVTRHKITRTTHVWRLKALRGKLLRAAESLDAKVGDGFRWVSFSEPEVAAGSALKRTLQEIRERFPEA